MQVQTKERSVTECEKEEGGALGGKRQRFKEGSTGMRWMRPVGKTRKEKDQDTNGSKWRLTRGPVAHSPKPLRTAKVECTTRTWKSTSDTSHGRGDAREGSTGRCTWAGSQERRSRKRSSLEVQRTAAAQKN